MFEKEGKKDDHARHRSRYGNASVIDIKEFQALTFIIDQYTY